MAHMLDSMFSVRQLPWHGLGTILSDYPETWDEAREQAGLNWEPTVEPVYRKVGDVFVEVEGQRIIGRDDRPGATLGVVSEDMSKSLFMNAQLGPLIEAFQGEGLLYETAGSLRGGAQVWVLVREKEPFVIPGDPNGATIPYLAVQNSHDGRGSLRVQRLQTRIVCANTSAAADREAGQSGLEYVFRHTESITNRVEIAKKAVNGLSADRVAYMEWAAELMGMKATVDQRERFVTHFFPMPAAAEMISERVGKNIEEARGILRGILAGPTSEGIDLTAYGMVQAAGEYLDHYRVSRSPESKFRRCVLNGERMRTQAEKLARMACAS